MINNFVFQNSSLTDLNICTFKGLKSHLFRSSKVGIAIKIYRI